MKKLFLFFQLMVLATLGSFADTTLPGQCQVGLPACLKKDLISKKDVSSISSGNYGQTSKVSKFWYAYSDRDANVTYTSPDGGVKCTTLAFNEKVKIAKISGKYALVYSDPKESVIYPKISEQAQSKGWIPMDHLLLWQSCPTDERGIYQKALIVINLDHTKEKYVGNVYHDPDGKSKGAKLRTTLDFYFVMKESNGMVLLATECKMTGYTNNVLYGWVSKGSYVPWNQRSCLEPNWNPEDASYFSGKKATVYETASLSKPRSSVPLGRVNKVPGSNAATKYRMGPQEMRYPLLDNTSGNNDVYHCTAFARENGPGEVYVVSEKDVNTTTIIDPHLKEKSIINLIVVIDGTKSMGDFYPPMQKVIQQANEYFSDNHKVVKVGVVIYRDFEDGEYVTEMCPMTTPNDTRLRRFLETGGNYGIKSSPKDKSYTEALYKGIERALDAKAMGYSPENSNLMFVVGDCGNHLDDAKSPSQASLVKKMVDNNVQLTAFQVRNNNEQSFILFRKQMNEMVRSATQQQYAKLGYTKSRFVEVTNGYDLQTPKLTNSYFVGSTRYASMGQVMPSNTLYSLVTDSYSKFNAVIEAQKGTIYDAENILAQGTSEGSQASVDKKFLESIFSPEQIREIKRQNSLMAFQGYASKKDPENGRDYWKPVLYISSDEFAALMEKLQPVAAAAKTGSSNRRPYIEALKKLINTQLPDITDKEMNEKGVSELMALVAGLNVSTTALSGRTLLEIQDEKTVTQTEYEGMVSDFKKKYDKLVRIREQQYPFSLLRNNTKYYWIPVEDLP